MQDELERRGGKGEEEESLSLSPDWCGRWLQDCTMHRRNWELGRSGCVRVRGGKERGKEGRKKREGSNRLFDSRPPLASPSSSFRALTSRTAEGIEADGKKKGGGRERQRRGERAQPQDGQASAREKPKKAKQVRKFCGEEICENLKGRKKKKKKCVCVCVSAPRLVRPC